MDARFIIGAAQPEQFPPEVLPEVALLGRSNVGKSSLLNLLAKNKGLARISSTPGCTRSVNFYDLDHRVVVVDFPGYGFAKIPRLERFGWKPLVERYLLSRAALGLCLVLVDARRGWMEADLELRRWLEFHRRRYLVVATKVDKLRTSKQRREQLDSMRLGGDGAAIIPFSAVTGQGVREIWQTISKSPRK
jgi:GTP-binding protein